MKVDSYEFGKIVVEGQPYKSDLIIYPDHVESDWWRKQGHNLSLEDLEEVLNFSPDVLVIGQGKLGYMEVDDSVKAALARENIQVIAAKTDKAVREFARLTKSHRTVGAFHLTC